MVNCKKMMAIETCFKKFVSIKTCLSVSFFLFLSMMFLPAWSWAEAGNVKRVMVFPFEVMAGEDLAYMGKGLGRMLCTRIGESSGINVICMDSYPGEYGIKDGSLGTKAPVKIFQGVDFLLTGSVTVVGNRISTDARLSALTGEKETFQFHEDGTELGDVLPHAQKVAVKVRAVVTGENIPRDSAALTIVENQKNGGRFASSSVPFLAPRKLSAIGAKASDQALSSTVVGATRSEKRDSVIEIPAVSTPLFHSRELDGEIRGIVVADLNGDRHPELAVIFKGRVAVFSVQAGKLVKQTEFLGKSLNANLAIDAVDMDGDGQEELYITCIDKNSRINSFVMVLKNGSLELMAQDLPWFFRMVKHDGRMKLAGQAQGMDNLFSGQIHSLDFRDGKIYAEKTAGLLPNMNLYGFNRGAFWGNGKEQLAWLDDNDRLNITGDSDHGNYKGKDSLGSTLLFLDGKVDRFMGGGDGMAQRIFISQRIMTLNIDDRAGDELVTIVNKDVSKGFFTRFREFDSGYVKVLTWKEGRMVPLCNTLETDGYIPDFDVEDLDGDGFFDIAYVVVKKKILPFRKTKSVIQIRKLICNNAVPAL